MEGILLPCTCCIEVRSCLCACAAIITHSEPIHAARYTAGATKGSQEDRLALADTAKLQKIDREVSNSLQRYDLSCNYLESMSSSV